MLRTGTNELIVAVMLIARMNKAADNAMVVPSEYLEVVMTKR